MRHHLRLRMLRPRLRQPPRRERRVNNAGALPDLHVLAPGLLADVVPQIAVGQKQHRSVRRNRIDDLHRVARRAKNVALRLHFDRRIDVADHHILRVFEPELAYRFHRTALHQAAARVPIRYHHNAARVQYLRGLRHEPDAAKRNHIAFEVAGLARELQAIAHHVGKLLNIGLLVMVRQQNRTALLL